MTVGRSNDPGQFQPPANHIKIARYIPQTLLLPRCDAIIFHGGYNSLLSALFLPPPTSTRPFAIHYSLFAIHYSLFAIHYSLFAIH